MGAEAHSKNIFNISNLPQKIRDIQTGFYDTPFKNGPPYRRPHPPFPQIPSHRLVSAYRMHAACGRREVRGGEENAGEPLQKHRMRGLEWLNGKPAGF